MSFYLIYASASFLRSFADFEEAGFLRTFDSGVVLILHWNEHNYIPKDRYKATVYKKEKAEVAKIYDLISEDKDTMDTVCIQSGYNLDTQDRIGKDRIGNKYIAPTLEEIQAYCKQRNNNVDAQRFYDYYTRNDWKDSKGNKVKNWKQKVITWEKHDSAPVKTDNYKPMTEDKMSDEFKKHMEEDGW